MPTKAQVKTIFFAIIAIAAIHRIPQGKEILTGDTKFLGIF